jgi:hypothetical protein
MVPPPPVPHVALFALTVEYTDELLAD